VPFIQHQTKVASSYEDFEIVYQRELKKANARDGEAFREYIVKKVCEMRDFEKSLRADEQKRSLDLQDLANEFLTWVLHRCNILDNENGSLESLNNKQEEVSGEGTTLLTTLSTEQLKNLRKLLIKKELIAEIEENSFVYWLSGKPLKSISKIKWIGSKKMLAYMLTGDVQNKSGICIGFHFPTANKCFDVFVDGKSSKLDSNDRPKTGYSEIDRIIKTL
jgi:hypothetical protein